MDSKPIRKPGITAQDIGAETLLYSADEKLVHVLNPTAKLLWELCDGAHTANDMAAALRDSFSIPAQHEVLEDVQRTLEIFASKGLLQEGSF